MRARIPFLLAQTLAAKRKELAGRIGARRASRSALHLPVADCLVGVRAVSWSDGPNQTYVRLRAPWERPERPGASAWGWQPVLSREREQHRPWVPVRLRRLGCTAGSGDPSVRDRCAR